MNDSRPIITTDPRERIIERAEYARDCYDKALYDITRRVIKREITPREAREELDACSKVYESAIAEIYNPS